MYLNHNPITYVKNNDFDHLNILSSFSTEDKNDALMEAGKLGKYNMVKALLNCPDIDPTVYDNYPFRRAVRDNHLETAKLLLKDNRVDPSASSDYALVTAATQQFFELVDLLLNDKRVNPATNNNDIIIGAYLNNKHEIVEKFWNQQKVKDTLKNDNPNLFNALTTKDLQKKVKNL